MGGKKLTVSEIAPKCSLCHTYTSLSISCLLQMHCSSLEIESDQREGGDVLVAIASMVTEGRIPGKLNSKSRGFYEGPHCPISKPVQEHNCDTTDNLVNFSLMHLVLQMLKKLEIDFKVAVFAFIFSEQSEIFTQMVLKNQCPCKDNFIH